MYDRLHLLDKLTNSWHLMNHFAGFKLYKRFNQQTRIELWWALSPGLRSDGCGQGQGSGHNVIPAWRFISITFCSNPDPIVVTNWADTTLVNISVAQKSDLYNACRDEIMRMLNVEGKIAPRQTSEDLLSAWIFLTGPNGWQINCFYRHSLSDHTLIHSLSCVLFWGKL